MLSQKACEASNVQFYLPLRSIYKPILLYHSLEIIHQRLSSISYPLWFMKKAFHKTLALAQHLELLYTYNEWHPNRPASLSL